MKKFLFLIIIILVAVTFMQLWFTQEHTGQKKALQPIPASAASHAPAQLGGPFALTDQNGKTVHDSDFHGRVMLVFFGFTHCPDVCPATVMNLSKTMELLGAKGDAVAPIFISVDPQRDNPAALKDFLSNFDKRIEGLTGTEEQIKQVEESYKIYAAKSVTGNVQGKNAAYTVDHSAYIYVMDKDGKFFTVMPYSATPQDLVHAIDNAAANRATP